jgi:hypothetical protein
MMPTRRLADAGDLPTAALINDRWVVLARAVQDPRFSEEVLRSVRQKLG